MNGKRFLLLSLPWLTWALLHGQARAADGRKPNILVILSDDVGWAEYGFQGAKDIPTPNIDSIARNGIRFPQGYVSGPYCSPTRAGLMTGRYQTRFGHEFNSVARRMGLPLTETTFADRFHKLGHATAAIGKWHLGGADEYRATRRGYDEFYGTVANTSYYHPPQFVDSRVSSDAHRVADDAFYTTDAYADRAVDWIEKHKDAPWYLYLPFNAQHAPLEAPKKYLDRFPNIQDEKRKLFAAMMSAMDDAVGRVLGKIRDLGQEEETLIVFLSDNGGPTRSTTSNNLPLRGFKATTWEGGVRIPFCMQWKGKLPAGKTYDHPIIQLDILPTALAAAGSSIDPSWKFDGVNLLPYLTGEQSGSPHQTLYWRFGRQWAVRDGDWKLVVANGGSGSPELYNLAADIGEATDLARKQPDKVRELQALYDRWNAEQAPSLVPDEPAQTKKAAAKAAAKKAARKKAAQPDDN
jgi:arylsulfatase A-like enzyme